MIEREKTYLMHADTPVAKIEMAGEKVLAIADLYSADHLPVGTYSDRDFVMCYELESWMSKRCIPDCRFDADHLESVLGMKVSEALARSWRLSLADAYWFTKDPSVEWKKINFIDNGFRNSFASALFRGSEWKKDPNIPDLATNGIYKKAWIMRNGTPWLIKAGDPETSRQQCANEVAASRIASLMGIDCARYLPAPIGDEMFCASECFIRSSDEEFVTGDQIMRSLDKVPMSVYDWLCGHGMKEATDRMLALNDLIGNDDAHLLNIGIVRNVFTLKVKGLAPLFDLGNSFDYDHRDGADISDCAQPFCRNREKQRALIDMANVTLPDPAQAEKILRNVYERFCVSGNCLKRGLALMKERYRGLERLAEKQKEREEICRDER